MKSLVLAGLLAAFSFSAFGQLNTLTGTTLSAAVSSTSTTVTLTSVTGVVVPNASTGVAGSLLYVQAPGSRGEAMRAQSISGLVVTVARGVSSTAKQAAPSGSLVLIGPSNQFYSIDPSGGCTTANTYVTPYVNVLTGNQFLCSTITLSWVPGFGNDSRPPLVTAAVASAAGVIVPSGQLFHITGTAAITGFTLPLGYQGGPICVIPDAVFTTTAAGNIALASTAVVSKRLCFSYDAAAAKPFFPSY